jgi:hypothetical protein
VNVRTHRCKPYTRIATLIGAAAHSSVIGEAPVNRLSRASKTVYGE